MKHLHVWMNGLRVGTWSWSSGAVSTFHYDRDWVNSEHCRPLSLSIPIPAGQGVVRGAAVDHYFSNLLPDDEEIRKRIRTRTKAGSTDAFDLLTAMGRDCVGAVQLLPDDRTPQGFDRIEGQPLSAQQIAHHLSDIATYGGAATRADQHGIYRISLAGMQEKTAFLWHEGQWTEPQGATPTSHIFKLPLGFRGVRGAIDMRHSVENEWLCGRILSQMGFDVAPSEIMHFGDHKVLVVARFDRQPATNAQGRPMILRIPQEDLCQASGVPPAFKYERDGGPGMAQCLAVLAASSQGPADRVRFMLAQLAFWLLGAIDGHAKNFSIFHERHNAYRMTPLYDVLSIWPVVGRKEGKVPYERQELAMALRSKNVHYQLRTIQARHWRRLAERSNIADAWDNMLRLVHRTVPAIDAALGQLPPGFPQEVAEAIRAHTARHVQRFLGEMSLRGED